MDKEAELAIVRRAFAKQILTAADVRNGRVEDAYADVRREHFLPAGPWNIFRWMSGVDVPTPNADPVYVYTNDVIEIDAQRRINNGEPAFHARLIASALPLPGEHVVHIGTGLGYYTAILAHLVGPAGRVTGIEFEADLAARAKANLAGTSTIEIIQGDGTTADFETADVIYVNAGTTQPAALWLDRLAEGGRLILPMTTEPGFTAGRSAQEVSESGVVFRIERLGAEFRAEAISTVAIFPCAGARDPVSEAALSVALANGRRDEVTKFYRHGNLPEERCWLRGATGSFAYS